MLSVPSLLFPFLAQPMKLLAEGGCATLPQKPGMAFTFIFYHGWSLVTYPRSARLNFFTHKRRSRELSRSQWECRTREYAHKQAISLLLLYMSCECIFFIANRMQMHCRKLGNSRGENLDMMWVSVVDPIVNIIVQNFHLCTCIYIQMYIN